MRRTKSVILDPSSLTENEKAIIAIAKYHRPECSFSFVQYESRGDSPTVMRDLFMFSKYSIQKVCPKCFLRQDQDVCTHCSETALFMGKIPLEETDVNLRKFMAGEPANIDLLLDAKRNYYARRPNTNCVYLSILFLSDFEVNEYGQVLANAYAKFGHTARGIKIRDDEHEKGLRRYIQNLSRNSGSIYTLPSNIQWFPTKNDTASETDIKRALKKYMLGRTLIGYNEADHEKMSVEIIRFPVEITHKMYQMIENEFEEHESVDAADLVKSFEEKLRVSEPAEAIVSLENEVNARGGPTMASCLLEVCGETVDILGIYRAFELSALRHADDFREDLYKTLYDRMRELTVCRGSSV